MVLHIHNGESTAGTLREFKFPGEHFAFQEVLVDGPAPAGLTVDQWQEVRAEFLAAEYEIDVVKCRNDLKNQESLLESFNKHDEVILWFEHDLFCQVNLIYLLDWFSRRDLEETRLSLICIGEFPGKPDFHGLGELTGAQMASLFETRHSMSREEFGWATVAWGAYTSSTPEPLESLLRTRSTALPLLGPALRLHLERFPSVRNGLGRIENEALKLIESGLDEFGKLFPAFCRSGPAYGLGDAQFWNMLRRLADSGSGLVSMSQPDVQRSTSAPQLKARFELTDAGRAVLSGEMDCIKQNGIDRWLGGVHLVGSSGVWRWDESVEKLVQSD
jgi:hypothetical protein